jgi:hypothetical protein
MARFVFEIVHKPYKVDTGFMGLEADFPGPAFVLAPTPELAALAFQTLHPDVHIQRVVQHMRITFETGVTNG